jgi:hypothetical protein
MSTDRAGFVRLSTPIADPYFKGQYQFPAGVLYVENADHDLVQQRTFASVEKQAKISKSQVGVLDLHSSRSHIIIFCRVWPWMQICEVLAKHVVALPNDPAGRKKVVTSCFQVREFCFTIYIYIYIYIYI